MPWYWTDDIARALIDAGRLSVESAQAILAAPVAVRRIEPDLEDAGPDATARATLDDDEIPIAA